MTAISSSCQLIQIANPNIPIPNPCVLCFVVFFCFVLFSWSRSYGLNFQDNKLSNNDMSKSKPQYKWCIVPQCKSSSSNTPEKVFLQVPLKDNLRKLWLEAVDRQQLSATSCLYVCEDHFDVSKGILM